MLRRSLSKGVKEGDVMVYLNVMYVTIVALDAIDATQRLQSMRIRAVMHSIHGHLHNALSFTAAILRCFILSIYSYCVWYCVWCILTSNNITTRRSEVCTLNSKVWISIQNNMRTSMKVKFHGITRWKSNSVSKNFSFHEMLHW